MTGTLVLPKDQEIIRPAQWVNIYPNEGHDTKEIATKQAGARRIACIEFSEGDGL